MSLEQVEVPMTDAGVIIPETQALDQAGNEAGVQDAVAAESANTAFFDRLRSTLGIEDADEDAVLSQMMAIRESSGKVTDYERQIAEFKAGYIQPKSEFVKQVNDLYDQLVSEGVTADQFPAKVAEYLTEAGKSYTALASDNPAAIIEMDYKRRYPGYSPRQIDALVREGMRVIPAPDVADFDGPDDPEFMAAEDKHIVSKTEFQDRVNAIAANLEAAKPKLDFKPKGVKSAAEVEAENEAFLKEVAIRYSQSFQEGFAKTFKGYDIGGVNVPVKVLEADGKTFTKEFAPVEDMLRNPDKVMAEIFLDDERTILNPNFIAEYGALKHILAPKLFERAKSEALKAFQDGTLNQDGKVIRQSSTGSGGYDSVEEYNKRVAASRR